jgi:hypothetical protein
MDHLERARTNLRRASEEASGPVHTQLDSLQSGIGAESDRETDRDGPDSTIDRIAEVRDKLESLQDEAENPETKSYMGNASDHLREYMEEHPHGE